MRLATIAVSVGVLLIASGCGAQSPPASPASSGSAATAVSPAPRAVSQFDPRWMTLDLPPSWTESERRITNAFQQFGLRPVGETEPPRNCNGCGSEPPTAFLTVYAPGTFDPAEVRAAAPTAVNTDGDGLLGLAGDSDDAVLAWPYADGAWATVRGRTTATSGPDRLLELAKTLHPAERTAIRVPVAIPGVPAPMSLTEISVDRGRYGTTMEFGTCGRTDRGAIPDCYGAADTLDVQIWPDDGFAGHIGERGNRADLRPRWHHGRQRTGRRAGPARDARGVRTRRALRATREAHHPTPGRPQGDSGDRPVGARPRKRTDLGAHRRLGDRAVKDLVPGVPARVPSTVWR